MKMLRRSLFPALAVLMVFGFGCRPAFAQWAVFDGANLQENIAKYALEAQQREVQLSQYENQIMREEMMYENMMQNSLALKDDLHHPLYLVANALTSPMLRNTAAGDVGGALMDGIEVSGQTQIDLQATRDAIGAALSEAESGGNSQAAQFHAANQLAAVQVEIAEAQAQQQAARLDEQQAIEESQQQYLTSVATEAKNTHYMPIQSGAQSADSGESICAQGSTNKYCSPPPGW